MILPSDERGIRIAKEAAAFSTRPVPVGASIDGSDLGWNKLPDGLGDGDGVHSRTVHAEIDAIYGAFWPVTGKTLFVTCPVCHRCAPIVIHAGITRVVTLPPPPGLADWYEASFAAARAMFAEAGVECVEVEG